MKVLIRRPGSGQVVHSCEPHGVSSLRLDCGRLVIRNGLRILDADSALPPGTPTSAPSAPRAASEVQAS